MKVFVMTEAKLFGPEIYVDVKPSFKAAEKAFRTMAPHMRKTDDARKTVTSYFTDSSNQLLFFIHEVDV